MRKFTKVLQLLVVVLISTTIVFNYANAQQTSIQPAKKQVEQFFTGNSTDADLVPLTNVGPVINPLVKVDNSRVVNGYLGSAMFKNVAHVIYDPNDWPTPKQGGDVVGSATVFTALPYTNSGTTVGYVDDYDEACPYTGSTSPDVVYSFAPGADIEIDIDLIGSIYDTKVFVYENTVTPGTPYACNDDYYPDYVSALFNVPIFTGNTYFIVIDGYGGDAGDYVLTVTESDPIVPCIVDCPPGGIDEGEGVVPDEYEDMLNGGCNSVPPVFMNINDGDTYCGIINTFTYGGSNYRDTDWYRFDATSYTEPFTLTWEGAAECPFLMFVVQANSEDCVDYTILGSVTGDCDPITQSYTVSPGVYWVLMMPSVFEGFPTQQDYWATLTTSVGPPPMDNDMCADATPINEVTDLAFSTTVATFDGPGTCTGSPNIWYNYTPTENGNVTISLCGSDYDTYLGVYSGFDCATMTNIICNDDACGLQSEVIIPVTIGEEIKIEVGGYSTNVGDGILNVFFAQPCIVDCPPGGILEGEGVVPDEYEDMLNGGCNSVPPVFMNINDGDTYCGIINTFLYGGSNYRDTDWYRFDATSFTEPFDLTWEGAAEMPFLMFVVQANSEDCVDYTILGSLTGDCDPISQTYTVDPGVYWVLMMPSVFDGYPTQQDYWATLTTDAGSGPCVVDCPPGSVDEGEGPMYDEYVDNFNGGCNSTPPVFGNIDCNTTLCGSTGTYLLGGAQQRDTDWFILDLTSATDVTATFECETDAYLFFLLDPLGDCGGVTVEHQILVAPCTPTSLTATLDPALGSWYVWVGPSVFTGAGFDNTYYVTLECANAGMLDGYLTYFNNGTPMDVVTVSGGGDSGMTDAMGYYGPLSVPEGPVMLDVAHDKPWSTFNVIDVVVFRQFLAVGVPALVPIQLMAADVFWQGGMAPNVLDAVVMRQQLANLDPVNYTAEDWLYYDVNVNVVGTTSHDFEAIMSGDVNGSNTPDPYTPPAGINNDLCSDAYYISSFPAMNIPGSTIGSTEDCSLTGSLGYVWAAFELPYANNKVTLDLYSDNLDNVYVTLLTTECDCDNWIGYTGFGSFAVGALEGLYWDNIPGPGTVWYPYQTGLVQQEDFTTNVYVEEM